MKKVSRLAVVGIIIVVVVACLGLTGCKIITVDKTAVSTEKVTVAEAAEKALKAMEEAKTYSIEKIAPGWMVILINKDSNSNWGWHSVETLTKGLKELGREYEIISVAPIHEQFYKGAPTGALLVEVKPRYS